jgi:hypothetical protein
MSELEELIADVKSQGTFDALEMDFIHTRAKGLMQLIQLLKVDENSGNGELAINDEKLEEIKETVSDIQEEVVEKVEERAEKLEEEMPVEKKESLSVEGKNGKLDTKVDDSVKIPKEKTHETEEEKKVEEKVEIEQTEDKKEELTSNNEDDDEMLDEEEEKTEANSRLGDSFLKGKSVNDLLTDQNKLEFKLSNRPVSSIKSAIGINDRFQYIRELFDGNADNFVNTVDQLDSKENMKQAVDYLRENFKWKKSETSLKFVNLVKRRFQNE